MSMIDRSILAANYKIRDDGTYIIALDHNDVLQYKDVDAYTVFNSIENDMGTDGGHVYVEGPATYDFDTTFSPVAPQQWEGGGMGHTVLRAATDLNSPVVELDGNTGMLIFRNFKIDGNKANQSGGVPTKADHLLGYGALQQATLEHSIIEKIWIRNAYIDGLRIWGNGATQTYGINTYRDIYSNFSGRFGIYQVYDIDQKFEGWIWVQSSGSDNVHMRRPCVMNNVHSVYAGVNAFEIQSDDSFFSNCYADRAQIDGWYINGVRNQFSNCRAFDCSQGTINTDDGWWFDNGADYCMVASCLSSGNSQQRNGFSINTNADYNLFAACVARDNATAGWNDLNANTRLKGCYLVADKN